MDAEIESIHIRKLPEVDDGIGASDLGNEAGDHFPSSPFDNALHAGNNIQESRQGRIVKFQSRLKIDSHID
ncbi:hypothetical protein D3C75_1062570 [compost metagenome]